MSGDCNTWDYLFVSDLHLALGYDPERRAYHAREDFFFDAPFFRWLRWADAHCNPGRRWELVFVGDALDFFPADREAVARYYRERSPHHAARAQEQVEAFERRYGFLPTPEKSAIKAKSICQGHSAFFRALAWFVGQGHRVVFLRGNHDLELFWRRVQDQLREFIAREYSALEQTETFAKLPDFEEQVSFQPGWLYHRRGVFYAEHGCQYELLNACPNPIHPVLPGDEQILSPDVGSLGVICFHNYLESAWPEWENRTDTTLALMDMIRRDPFKAVAIGVRHAPDFLRMAQQLWRAGRKDDLGPTETDFAEYAASIGLEPETIRQIYHEGDKPLLLRRPLAWLLFSPGGHVVKALLLLTLVALLVGAGALWYLVAVPALANLVSSPVLFTAIGPALQLLTKLVLWLLPPAVYAIAKRRTGDRYSEYLLFEAARRIHSHLREKDPDLRYYIFGHDHRPDARPVEQRANGRHVYYLNTGSWTPCFAEGPRRLQALGRATQFTFARLVRGEDGYEADLLRWNDDAGRADPQMVPAAQPSA
jgi:UDP-2,3-diacylglucosamine pyrophosphatase LpxH